MDFRLRVFLSVAKHLSFTKAALELKVSQPAITKHIQELENTYGVQLFVRQAGKVSLSEKGRIMEHHARQVLRQYEILKCEMDFAVEELQGELSLGTTPQMAQSLMESFLPKLISKFPNLQLSIITAPKEQLEQQIHEGRLHFAILLPDDSSPCPEFQYTSLQEFGLGHIMSKPGKMTLQLQKLVSFARLWYNISKQN